MTVFVYIFVCVSKLNGFQCVFVCVCASHAPTCVTCATGCVVSVEPGSSVTVKTLMGNISLIKNNE